MVFSTTYYNLTGVNIFGSNYNLLLGIMELTIIFLIKKQKQSHISHINLNYEILVSCEGEDVFYCIGWIYQAILM